MAIIVAGLTAIVVVKVFLGREVAAWAAAVGKVLGLSSTSLVSPGLAPVDTVEVSVFAPPLAAPGDQLLVQVFLHSLDLDPAVATATDPTTERKGGATLDVTVERGQARIFTRGGHDWTDKFPVLAAVAAELGDGIIDGELGALDAAGYSHFSDLRSRLAKGQTDDLVIFAFDLLFDGATDLRPMPLSTRKERLRGLLDAVPGPSAPVVDRYIRYVKPLEGAPAGELFAAACALNWEGIVSKRLSAPYRGDRAGAWIKAKCRPAIEVRVAGWTTENGRFRSLIAGIPDEAGGLRYGGTIHTGYSDANTKGLVERLKALEVDRAPFTSGEVPRKTRDIHWARPDLIADVEMAELTASGKLRHASFKGLKE